MIPQAARIARNPRASAPPGYFAARAIRRILLCLLLLAVYLNVGFVVGNNYVSGAYAICLGAALIVFQVISDTRIVRPLAILSVTTSVWLITIIASPSPFGFLGEHLLSILNLLVSTLVSYSIYYEMRRIERHGLRRAAVAVMIALIVLASLEAFTSFRSVVNDFRNFVFSGTNIYDAVQRDILYAGRIRPTGFTQEPSHLAKGLAIAMVGAVMLTTRRIGYWIGGAIWLFCLFLVGSPTLVLAPSVIFVAFVFRNTGRSYTDAFLRFLAVL